MGPLVTPMEADDLDTSLTSASDLLAALSSSTTSSSSPHSAVSMDLSSQFPALLDDVPSLDELLLPECEELDVNHLSKAPLDSSDELPAELLDPTLLFPEPVELRDQSQDADATTVDSCSSSSSSQSVTQTPSIPVAVVPPSPPRRKRRKDELDFLRLKAKELELQLRQLQNSEAGVLKEEVEGVSVWRRVARRQLEGKKRVERENEKLRGMVEGQLAIVQNLEKLLRKRSALEESGAWASERKRVRVENEAENDVFERILRRLDDQHKQTDAVFLQNSFARKKTDGQHMQVKPDGAYGMFTEFLASKILPFEMHATATQFWRSMAQPHLKLRDGHYSLVDGTEDTLSAKMAFTVQHKKHQVIKDAWFVVKRFIEEDRCVFVWACETKVEGTLSAAQSMRHRDSGWTLVEKQCGDDDTVSKSLESTIIQSCVQVRTELPEVMPNSQEEVAILTDIVTSSFLENLDGIHQSVEDALLEEAMRLN